MLCWVGLSVYDGVALHVWYGVYVYHICWHCIVCQCIIWDCSVLYAYGITLQCAFVCGTSTCCIGWFRLGIVWYCVVQCGVVLWCVVVWCIVM